MERASVDGKPNPIEPLRRQWRLLAGLLRWILRRYQADAPGSLAYHQTKKVAVYLVLSLGTLEGVGLHLVLLLIFGSRWWIWTIFALDMYTLVWIIAMYAAMVVRPHRIEADVLRLRQGHLAELTVDRRAVRGARIVAGKQARNGRLMVDAAGRGVFCSGDTTVAIDLDPEFPPHVDGLRVTDAITTLHVTADRPREFVAALTTVDHPVDRIS
ncbi:MAG TPA: hypothetical protein VHZ97_13335 [Pseudonocardiaceae bacterium]|nr:hypothetical protein [Pseudonocardiaceae bacterium]